MPQILKSAKDGQIAVKELYTVGDVAHLIGVAHATAARLIDSGEIRGLWLPTPTRQRRVTHRNLIRFVKSHPDFRYILDKLQDYDPRVDFPEGAEPPEPERPLGTTGPWGPELPRSVRCGRIPQADAYGVRELAFLLGRARRTVNTMLNAGVIPAVRVPAQSSLTSWRWKICHGPLIKFLQQDQRFRFALGRIQGGAAESAALSKRSRAAIGASRTEPLVSPGSPGWRGHPGQTRRGGFKRGPKLADGRQPSKTSAD